jgi:hypothetical protein
LSVVRPDATHDDVVHALKDEYLECRDLRHAWKRLGIFRETDEFGTYLRKVLQCSRCRTRGIDTLTLSGVRLRPRRYEHPDGYSIEGGLMSLEVRVEQLRRVTIFDSEDDMLKSLVNGRNRKHA